jgi:hypothetical protein
MIALWDTSTTNASSVCVCLTPSCILQLLQTAISSLTKRFPC